MRNAATAATSSDLPWRDSGVFSTICRMTGCCSNSWRPIGVSMMPGDNEVTRPPRAPQLMLARLRSADHADLRERVRRARCRQTQSRRVVKKVGRQRLVEHCQLIRLQERPELMRRTRRKAHRSTASHHQRLERVEQELSANQIHFENRRASPMVGEIPAAWMSPRNDPSSATR